MMAPERALLSGVYLGAMGATLWASLAAHSYLLCILASLVQLAALVIYQLSYFPGGLAGAKLVWMSAGRVLRPALAAGSAACSACWSGAAQARSLTDLLPL
jgi:ABC-type nitrate/sulfonate/bicarbonate transport system substrate-binding protein